MGDVVAGWFGLGFCIGDREDGLGAYLEQRKLQGRNSDFDLQALKIKRNIGRRVD